MNLDQKIQEAFYMNLPFKDGVWWNGLPGELSNLPQWNIATSRAYAAVAPIYTSMGIKGHSGLDIAAKEEAPEVFPTRCFVTLMGDNEIGGKWVKALVQEKEIDGKKYYLEIYFGHLKKILVETGKWYEAGELVGLCGHTGKTSGSHLHFGIRPHEYLENGNSKVMYPNNGYWGYVNPALFMPQCIWTFGELKALKLKDMIFYKERNDSAIYQLGKDDKYHAFHSGETFKSLHGEFEDNKIMEQALLEPKGKPLALIS